MSHKLSRIIIIKRVVELISKEYKISLDEARNSLYNSSIVSLLNDEETGLYGESPYYVLSLYELEMNHKINK